MRFYPTYFDLVARDARKIIFGGKVSLGPYTTQQRYPQTLTQNRTVFVGMHVCITDSGNSLGIRPRDQGQ